MIGRTLGSYTLERELGRGGMGAVYVATHALLRRAAAIKVLRPETSRDRTAIERFFNEARAATAVKHAGIVEIYDLGVAEDGTAYIAMELLEGETLAARLRRLGRFDEPAALAVARQIVDALAAAHRAGIVHRDLKPDNVFLVPDAAAPGGTRVKLLDFGIAKLVADGADASAGLTATGAVVGTPYYMSPEQCRGLSQIDARADLYALGCILFELLCGRVPFQGAGTGDVIAAHIHVEPPSPRALAGVISPRTEALILRLLEKSPELRPASAAAVAAELTRIADDASDAGADASGAPDALAATLASGVRAAPGARLDPLGATAVGPGTASGSARAVGAPSASARAAAGSRRWWWIGLGAAGAGAAVVVALLLAGGGRGATARDGAVARAVDAAPPPVVIDAAVSLTSDQVYLELDGIRGETGVAEKLIPELRAALVAHLASSPSILTTWPGGEKPTAAALADAGVFGAGIDATLTLLTLRDPEQPGVECTLQFMLWTHPDRAMLGMSKTGATVRLPTLDDATLHAGAVDCIGAVATTMLDRHVLPLLRGRSLARGHADEARELLARARDAQAKGDVRGAARRARAVLAIDGGQPEAQQILAAAVTALEAEARAAHQRGDDAAAVAAFAELPEAVAARPSLERLLAAPLAARAAAARAAVEPALAAADCAGAREALAANAPYAAAARRELDARVRAACPAGPGAPADPP